MSSFDHITAVKTNMEDAFPQGLDAEQIKAVIQFAKLIRFRGRNNAALENLCRKVFPEGVSVRHVPFVTDTGRTYNQLVVSVAGVTATVEESE